MLFKKQVFPILIIPLGIKHFLLLICKLTLLSLVMNFQLFLKTLSKILQIRLYKIPKEKVAARMIIVFYLLK